MKLVSKALLAAGLVAISACGGREEANNIAADDTGDVNVAADDLTISDNALFGNDTIGTDSGNATGADTNTSENTAGNTL